MLPTVGGANSPSKAPAARAGDCRADSPKCPRPPADGDSVQVVQSWQKSPVVFCSCWPVINSLQDSGFSFEGSVVSEVMMDFNRVYLNCSGACTKLGFLRLLLLLCC